MDFNTDINLLGVGELQNAVIQNLAQAPTTNLTAGRLYFNTADHTLYVYDGTSWKNALSQGLIYTFTSPLAESSGTVSVGDASTSAKGVIEIATDTEVSTGTDTSRAVTPKQLAGKVNKLSTAPTAGTYPKVTINSSGLVTGGSSLASSDIPDISATYLLKSLKGANSGVAELDSSGKVPSSQLPSFVDDVVELKTLGSAPSTCSTGDMYFNTTSKKIFTATGTNTWGTTGANPEKSKIYVALDTNYSYRWGGSSMTNISSPVAAATESTAGIAEIATETEAVELIDDTKIITPAKLERVLTNQFLNTPRAYSTTNPALTASNGKCTWQITHPCGERVVLSIYKVSDDKQVIADVKSEYNTATITFNSSSNIAADTYRADIIGK